MNRTLQLLGLLLIGLLSFQADPVSALPSVCVDVGECTVCEANDDCITWTCPVGHPRGVGIRCDDE